MMGMMLMDDDDDKVHVDVSFKFITVIRNKPGVNSN